MKKLNGMFQELITILFTVSNTILQELADEPEKIGIDPVAYLYELHMNFIQNIRQTYQEELGAHIELFEDLVEFFNSSVYVYLILNRSYERPIIKVPVVQKCINKIMKGISHSIEMASLFNKMYKNQIQHQLIKENIAEIAKLVKPDTPKAKPEPTFLNTLINLGWAKNAKTEAEILKRNLEYENQLKKIKELEMKKAETQRVKIYNDERRELAVDLISKGFDNIPI